MIILGTGTPQLRLIDHSRLPVALRRCLRLWSLIPRYWKRMAGLFAAMLVETAMGLATPWPLKIVLDSVFETPPLASVSPG